MTNRETNIIDGTASKLGHNTCHKTISVLIIIQCVRYITKEFRPKYSNMSFLSIILLIYHTINVPEIAPIKNNGISYGYKDNFEVILGKCIS